MVCLRYTSPDGDQGYPGELDVYVRYTLHPSALEMTIEATSSKMTPLSLTNHAYFNLSAGQESTVRSHTLQIDSEAVHPDDGSGDGIMTGEREEVEGGVQDLREPQLLSAVIDKQAAAKPHWSVSAAY